MLALCFHDMLTLSRHLKGGYCRMRKNLLRIPAVVREKLATIDGSVVVGCACWYAGQQIRDGLLAHLGITLSAEGVSVPESVVPRPTQGRYSRRNLDGLEVVRRDLPKETYFITFESPNYGDWSKGSHTTTWHKERYVRDFEAPRVLAISMSCPHPEPGRNTYMIAFRVEEPLDPAAADFDHQLLGSLNLLQENAYDTGVEPAAVALADYYGALRVNWELLPPGSRDEALERIFQGRQPSREERDVANERLTFFESLRGRRTIIGRSGFSRYIGTLLEDDLVVLENIRYGNAVYVLYGAWAETSQRSRIDLLTGRFGQDFDRVIHRPGWEERVRILVRTYRARRH
jgi:hypothetical protein